MSEALPIVEAAKALDVSPATLQRWIRQGCPCIEEGRAGRNNGAIVDLDEVSRWRAEKYDAVAVQREQADVLSIVATALIDCLKRDFAHERVDIPYGLASGLLALAYQRIWQNLTRQPLDEFVPPPEIAHLCTIYVEYVETHSTFRRERT